MEVLLIKIMDLKELSRPLDINTDVEFRVQSIKKQSDGRVFAVVVPYKDARTDAARLDEVVGPINWQRDHKLINGNLYCGIGIYNNETSQWVWKWDIGTPSNTEKEKGEASDSFKRAGFNWGIGRELYEFPFIYIELLQGEYYESHGSVKEKNLIKKLSWFIERNEKGEITYLAAYLRNDLRWSYGKVNSQNKIDSLPKTPKVATPQKREVLEIGSDNYKKFFNLYVDPKADIKTLEKQLRAKYSNAIEVLEAVKNGVIE